MCTKMTKGANIVDNCKFTILGKSSKPTNTEVQFYTKSTVLNKCVQPQMRICAAKNNETITRSHKRIKDVTTHVFRAWSVPKCICSWPGLCWGNFCYINSQQWPPYAKDFSLWTKETLTALPRSNLAFILWPLDVVLCSRSNCLYAGH